MAVAAIPTTYRGTNFRSRLEARWAAFFDALDWPWAYEPVDFNGWIPDFALLKQRQRPVYVEVKPVFTYPKAVGEEIVRAVGLKDSDSGRPYIAETLIIVGADIDWNAASSAGDRPGMGWSPYMGGQTVTDVSHDNVVFCSYPENRIGVCDAWGSFADYLSAGYDEGQGGWSPALTAEIRAAWRNSVNATQWKGR